MRYVCALDAGTTGVRAVAVGSDGTVVTHRYREFTQHFPLPGRVEHDATEIADAIFAVTAELIADLGAAPVTIGITNQRETIVAWDRATSRPLHRAIVWQDRRGADRCEQLARDRADLVRSVTGLVPDPYFSATKIEWLFDRGGVPRDDSVAIGTVDSWLLWRLTGGAVHATEPSNASRTMLFDIGGMSWSTELCGLFDIPAGVLPQVRPTAGRFGTTSGVDGIPDGIPISGIAGDQQAALFGQTCFNPGTAKNTYGTGSFVLLNVGEELPRPVDGLLTTVAWQLTGEAPTYALEGSIFATGSAVQWLRDGLGVIGAANELEALAMSCTDTGGVVLVPAFTGLGSPWWDPAARGTILGLTRGSGRAQLARAVIDAMVYQTRDVIDAMVAGTGRELTELRVDGGAAVMDLLCRAQADQLGTPVVRAANVETTALGAAFLAGLAEGFWRDRDELVTLTADRRRFEPVGAPDEAGFRRWHRAVERARAFGS